MKLPSDFFPAGGAWRFCALFIASLLVSCKPASHETAIPQNAASPPPAQAASSPAQTAAAEPAKPAIIPPPPAIIPRKITSGIPEETRVREIAGFLSPTPSGVGKPITDRAAWAAAFPNGKVVVALAEAESKEPIPVANDDLYLIYSKKGTRKEYEIPCQERMRRLADFTEAECIENKGRFLPVIEAVLAAILSERTWVLPAHDSKLEAFNGKPVVDLGVSMHAWNLVTVDWLLGDKLQSATREKIHAEIMHRVLEPYKAQVLGKGDGAGWICADNNWNAVCHAGVIGSALALLPSAEDRAWYLAALEIYIHNYQDGFPPDGYCSEGVGYWNYGFGHYVLMTEAVGAATGWRLNLYAPEIIGKVLSFPLRLEMMPGVYPAYSDADPSVKPTPFIFQLAGRHLPGVVPPAGKIIVSGAGSHPMTSLLYETMTLAFADSPAASPTDGTEPAKSALPLRDSFPDAGVVVCRCAEAASGKGFAIAMKAGNNNEHHNHNDVGSYVVTLDGKTPLVDPGMEVYTSRTFSAHRYDSKVLNSYGHSVPLVAGQLQDTGAEARGSISVVETTDAQDTYVLDLTLAYVKSVPSLKRLTRTLKFIRAPKPAIEIADEVEFDSPQQFGDALITFGKCQPRSADTLVVYDAAQAVQVKVETGGRAFTVKDEVLDEKLPSGQKARRIGLSLNEPAERARIVCRIESAAPPTLDNPVIEKAAGEARGPVWNKAITVAAKDFSAQTGGAVEVVPKYAAASGHAIRMWNNDGHELAWKFQVPRGGVYGILLRYCNGGGREALRALRVDGSPADGIRGAFAFPPTGGWSADRDDWKEVWLAQSGRVYIISLAAGEHTVSLRNAEGGAVTLDTVSLVPLEK